DADGRGFAKKNASQRFSIFRLGNDAEQRRRTILFHLNRGQKHIPRAGREEAIENVIVKLRIHVVDVSFHDEHLFLLPSHRVRADDQTEQVRPIWKIFLSRAIADPSMFMLGCAPKLLPKVLTIAAPVGVTVSLSRSIP